VKFTRPAVSAAATIVLKQVTASLEVPGEALDLAALQDIVNMCKKDMAPSALISTDCPVAIIKPVAKPLQVLNKSRLKQLNVSKPELSAVLPTNMSPKKKDLAVAKAQGLADFLVHHGINDDVVRFVLGVQKIVPPDWGIDWKLWLCASDATRRPPLWWRVFMILVESTAGGGERYFLQMSQLAGSNASGSDYFVNIMNTQSHQGQVPNTDIWTWDTAAALRILRTCLFNREINEIAATVVKKVRNRLGHFDVDMSFSEGFDCIDKLLTHLQQNKARDPLKRYYNNVRSWFPAFSQSEQMEQARLRPMHLTTRQYDTVRDGNLIDKEGNIKDCCRFRLQCGASSGKTVVGMFFAGEFVFDMMSPEGDFPTQPNMQVLFLTHAPILASRAATDLRDQLQLKLDLQHRNNNVTKVKVHRLNQSDDCDVYRISVGDKQVITVSTINSAIDFLLSEVFLGGVVVDECQSVYGGDFREGATKGQSRVPAKEIEDIVERWGGACYPHEGARRLVLLGDERNQSMRRRFNDTGKDLVTCDGCKARRLPCWMAGNFTQSFYGRVERIFNAADTDGDGQLSKAEFQSLVAKVGDMSKAQQKFPSYDDESSSEDGDDESAKDD
jgi:hypothetical protein